MWRKCHNVQRNIVTEITVAGDTWAENEAAMYLLLFYSLNAATNVVLN